MARFPLIVKIFGERARIKIAPAGKPSKAEETAQSWLSSPGSAQLIDADKLQRMQQFIARILNSARPWETGPHRARTSGSGPRIKPG